MAVGGLAPLLAVRCLQADAQAQSDAHDVVLVGNAEARSDAQSAGVRVLATICPPLHSVARLGPGLRQLLREQAAKSDRIVVWGGNALAARALARKCAAASRRAAWMWVDVDAGTLHALQAEEGQSDGAPRAVQLAMPSPAELARVLPLVPRAAASDGTLLQTARRIGLLADPASPGHAASMTAVSSVLHAGGAMHACVVPEHASVFRDAARRATLDRGLAGTVIETREPVLRWLHTVEACVVLALQERASRWALGTLVHAALARGATPVLCESDARVLAELGCVAAGQGAGEGGALLAKSDAPAHVARAMLALLLAPQSARQALALAEEDAFARAWATASAHLAQLPVLG